MISQTIHVISFRLHSFPYIFTFHCQLCVSACAAANVRSCLRRHVHAPLICQGSARVLLRTRRCALLLAETYPRLFALSRQRVCVLAQPQMCVAACGDISTPLCFVKAARVCSCAAADVRCCLRRHIHAPLLCQGSVRVLLGSRRFAA